MDKLEIKRALLNNKPSILYRQSVRWKPMFFPDRINFYRFVRQTGIFGNLWLLLTHKPVGLLTCDILEVCGRFYWPGPSGLWLNLKTASDFWLGHSTFFLSYNFLICLAGLESNSDQNSLFCLEPSGLISMIFFSTFSK